MNILYPAKIYLSDGFALVRPSTQKEIKAAEALYEGAFPPSERRPYELILNPSADDDGRIYMILKDSRMVGILNFRHFDGYLYLEHYAILPSERNRQLGTSFLQALKQFAVKPIIIEVEPEGSNAMADRRIAFYRRNGFEILPCKYRQPPVSPDEDWVDLLLMATAPLDGIEAGRSIHRCVYHYFDE